MTVQPPRAATDDDGAGTDGLRALSPARDTAPARTPSAPHTLPSPPLSSAPSVPSGPSVPSAPLFSVTPPLPSAPMLSSTPAIPSAPAPSSETPSREASSREAPSPETPSAAPPAPPSGETASNRFLAKAALVTIALSVAGALLGLGRDQALAHLFGADSATDAFLVAWTLPEFAATLLIEDGLAFVLVPAFSMAVARRAQGAVGDPVRALVATTLPRLTLAVTAVAALLIAGAPYLVEALAPGLPDPALAVDCTRLTATCVFTFGLAGYCSAALRAHRRFVAPAAIYVAYNTGIITAMFVLGGRWGVRAAALGVAVGGALMVVAQAPSLWRQLRHHEVSADGSAVAEARPMDLTLISTVLLFALCRQSQVLIERFLASSLPAGAISHLNYAQKVAQMPMVLSLMLCTVTFPVVAQAMAEGDTERARVRVERDLALVSCTVLLGTAAVVACAPQIIQLLFQRGAFTAQDTSATAAVMRVYAVGLLGHTLVGALVRSYFSSGRPTWYPLFAMTAGIVATSWIGALAVGSFGVCGIAAANAGGITLSALLLLYGMGPRNVPIRTRRVVAELGKPVRAALVAGAAGALCASRAHSPLVGLVLGGTVVTAVFAVLAWALGIQALAPVLRSLKRRLPHVRFR
ncbi:MULTISPECIES: murein biosynthesis integral membrane protein MurJ [unclassified Streptomyces]|uniref:murein biosynthesis integral membrane protein MurJ n=1 Tax=unclassified Streptomyces TaxID=2593676 RepID=UPI002E3410AD|nr:MULTISPECIES: lipid II flippase MurJ [unclassified Streptomyces]